MSKESDKLLDSGMWDAAIKRLLNVHRLSGTTFPQLSRQVGIPISTLVKFFHGRGELKQSDKRWAVVSAVFNNACEKHKELCKELNLGSYGLGVKK